MAILGLSTEHANAAPYPAHFDIEKVIRPNILSLHPYRCARDDYSTGILLDANENALGHSVVLPSSQPQTQTQPNGNATSPPNDEFPSSLHDTLDLDLHRYPDPSHPLIKARIAEMRNLPGTEYVFLGVGSDEVIDMLMRVCVTPGKDGESILITPPTYGMYGVCAQVNDVGVVKVPLELGGDAGEGGDKGRFSLRVDKIKEAIVSSPSPVKLIFICSPGNPTGTLIPLSTIQSLLEFEEFKGIVVVDEAYIDFAGEGTSACQLVKKYSNVCVLQTLSKTFGLAGIRSVKSHIPSSHNTLIFTERFLRPTPRLGIAIAQPPLIQIMSNTKAPYNISTPTAHIALTALSPASLSLMKSKVDSLITSRAELISIFEKDPFTSLGVGEVIGGNDANFIVLPILSKSGDGKPDSDRAHRVYKELAEHQGVVVRYRGHEPGCAGCLRITVGSPEENKVVLQRLQEVLTVM
ncbi:hypothetical protein CVT24_001281 [Panaeolus cyanescens]|uniref:histidinol-phosphate transaminase n=1 Tax=Panaeolus cyanescens TaxID=181874 RepID=A0A409YZ28_9AGAR|nr:hypothetical protein CVT24_001281 [Panaeolus cyanescens]